MAYCSFLRVESPRPPFCPFPPAPSFPPPRVSSPFSYSRYFQLIQLTPSHSLSPFYIRPHFASSIEPFLVFILSFASRRAAASFPFLFSLIFFLCHLPYRFLLFLRVPDLPTYPLPPSTFLLPLDNPVLAILVLILSHSRSFSFSCSIALFPLHTPYNFLYMPDWRVSSTSLSRSHLCSVHPVAVVRKTRK